MAVTAVPEDPAALGATARVTGGLVRRRRRASATGPATTTGAPIAASPVSPGPGVEDPPATPDGTAPAPGGPGAAQVADYWRTAGPRKWSLLAVPVVAVAAALVVGLQQPPLFEVVAAVTVPTTGQPTPTVVRQAVADFDAVLDAEAFTSDTSEVSGTPRGDLRGGLRSAQLGASATVELRYRGERREDVARTVEVAAQVAVAQYLAPRLVEAAEALEAQRTEAARASAALDESVRTTGVAAPEVDLRAAADEAVQLGDQRSAAGTAGDTAQVTRIDAQIADVRGQIEALRTLAAERQRLVAASRRADDGVADAGRAVQQIELQRTADDSERVRTSPPRALSRTPGLVQLLAGAAVGGALSAAVMLLLLERRSARERAPGGRRRLRR